MTKALATAMASRLLSVLQARFEQWGFLEDPRMLHIDPTEVLRSALAFYAERSNWMAREVPLDQLPPEARAEADEMQSHLDCPECAMEGVEARVVAMASGPALDGGEHARYALKLAGCG